METAQLYQLKKVQSDFPNRSILNAIDSYNFIKQFYGDDIEVYESFFILLLDIKNATIGYAKISQGGVVGTIIDTRLIAKYVIDSLATGVILAHNHPSGRLSPSKADLSITEQIRKGLQYFDTKVLDHIILSKDSYYSMCENGDLY